jgi:hypothetical protein
MMKNFHLLLSLFILLLSACTTSVGADFSDSNDDGVIPAESSATMAMVEPPAIETPEPTIDDQENIDSQDNALPDGSETIIDLAKRDLAQRLNIEISAITLGSDKEIVWPDATLGCPKPGMDFTPINIPGHILTLQAEGKRFIYHTDDENRVILCPAEGERPDEIFIMP